VHASQREKALAIGATDFFSLPPRELIATISERTETPLLRPMGGLPWLHGGVDRVYDTVATAGTLEMGVRVPRPHGTLVMVGVATPARFEWTPIYFKELAILGASGYGIETVDGARDHAFRLYLDLAARRRVEPGPLVTHTMPMQDFRQGFRSARQKATYASIKVLLEPSSSCVARRATTCIAPPAVTSTAAQTESFHPRARRAMKAWPQKRFFLSMTTRAISLL
jgi:threonine dehydrogenase-like Zn-dependent dehydrogenase